MDVNQTISERWAQLLASGAVVLDGIDETDGEPVYTFDLAILQVVDPELYHAHLDEVDENMLSLAEKGLVTIDFTNPEIGVELTDKGMKFAEDILAALNQT